MKFDLSGYQNPDGSLQAPEEELGFWGTVGDLAMSPVRGIAGAAEGVYDLADWALMDWLPDAEDNFGLGHSKTLAGGLVQGISQFMVGFVPGMAALSVAGRATGLASKVSKMSKPAQWAAGFGKATAAGAVADFAVFDAQEKRLSNLIQQFPSLQNPVTEFLAADEDDTEIEGRLKNLMEGGILGGMMEPFVMGLRSLRNARKAKAAGGNPDEALQKSWEAEQARQDINARMRHGFPTREYGTELINIKDKSGRSAQPTTVDELLEFVEGDKEFGSLARQIREVADEGSLGVRVKVEGVRRDSYRPGDGAFLDERVTLRPQTSASGAIHEVVHATTSIKVNNALMAVDEGIGHPGFGGPTAKTGEAYLAGLREAVQNPSLTKPVRRLVESYLRVVDEKGLADQLGALKKDSDTVGIANQADAVADAGMPYGMGNIDEFMAEAFTNREFQDLLRSIPVQGDKNLFTTLMDSIKEILGIPPKSNESTLLDRVVSDTESVMRAPREELSRNLAGTGKLNAPRNIATDESSIPTGARKPSEGFPFNLDRHSDRVGADEILEAQVRSASPEVQAELVNVRKMTNEDVRAHAEEVNEELGALGAGRFSKRELDELDSTGQLTEVVAKQNVLRNAHQQYVRLADELAEKARTGTAEDEVRFMLVQQRAEAVGVLVKRNQEKIAQALGAQRMQGTDMLPDRDLIPMEVLDGADPKFVDDALAELGGGDMTRGRKKVQDTIAKYQAVREAQGSGAATKFLQDKAKYPEMLVEYWINSILSGPLTHMVNMTSNTLNTLFLPFEKALGHAATFQFGQAAKDLGFYTHLTSQFQDAMSAAAGAFKNWGDDLDSLGVVDTKQGYDRSIRASNLPGLSNTIGGAAVDWIGKALNMPSRFLMAEDAFFKHLNYRAMAREGLFKEGAEAGKTGAELAQHVEEGLQKMIVDGQHYTYKTVRLNAEKRAADEIAKAGIKDPGERQMAMKKLIRRYMDQDWNRHVDPDTGENARSVLAKQALQYGREVTYTRALDDPDRSALVKATGKYNKLVNDVPLMRLITPFVRTPTNLLSFYLNRTVGAYADLAKMGYKGSVKYIKVGHKDMADAVAQGGPSKADVLGRFATGNMLMFGAGMAFHAGAITGGGPKDPARRKQLEATGWQPYSFRVGNEWYSYRRFDPFASFFGTIADFNEAMAESDGEDQQIFEAVMGAVVNAAARNVTNKSYLTGMARISNVLSNPDRYGSAYIESTIASMTPFSSLAGQTIGASEHQKEIRGIVDAIRTKYGLTSETDLEFLGITTRVEDRRNLFGDKVEKAGVLAPFPIHYTEIKDDVVMDELNTLGRQNAFSPPSKIFNSMDSTAYTNSKGQTLYDRWLELHGSVRLNGRTLKQSMKKLIQSRKYQNLPLEDFEGIESPRVGELRKLIRRYRAAAKERALSEFPEAKALNDRNTKIKHYRRAGRDIQSLLDY